MDHALIQCATRKQKITCDLYGTAGHYKRTCPRRNEDLDNSTEKRKVSKAPEKQSNTVTSKSYAAPKSASASQLVADAEAKAAAEAIAAAEKAATNKAAADKTAADARHAANAHTEVNARIDANAQTAANTLHEINVNTSSPEHQHRTRSTTGSSPPEVPSLPPTTQQCKSCKRTDHKIKSSHKRLRNPNNPNYIPETEELIDPMDTENDDGSASMQN
ncbi:uncharacterized protein ATC70_000285 [Mucor velutinosus]|uniref:Uncharacterized protein n=1 Tax=Mucor velutinosus TaxID=708070 RepID=A0AAN7DHB5_9FUNG|nr:hypothetical protein ATC70_000285 [Mucor velutinosus]